MKLVDFYADWCQPCKLMKPILEELEKEFPVEVEKVDADTNKERAIELGVMSIPTLIVFDEDKEITRFVGFTPKDKIISVLRTSTFLRE